MGVAVAGVSAMLLESASILVEGGVSDSVLTTGVLAVSTTTILLTYNCRKNKRLCRDSVH